MTEKTETRETASKGIFISADKPLDLSSVDSDLFSAILSGEVEFVRSRFRGNDKVSDAEAILMIRTRRAVEEKAFSKQIAASQFEHEQQDPAKKIGGAFFGGMTYDAFMRNQSRPDDGKNRQGEPETDLFGGYFMFNKYHDAYGGAYDQHGYQFANGNYKTAAGDLFDMAKGTITLAGGKVLALAPGLEKEGRKVLIMEKNLMDIVVNEFDAIQAEMAEKTASTPSLAGSLLNSAADIKPSANALDVGVPTAATTMAAAVTTTAAAVTTTAGAVTTTAGAVAATDGISMAAMAVAAPVAVAAVASTMDMGMAFANDEAFRAAASYKEGGGLDRMAKGRPATEFGIRAGERFIFENIKNGMTGDDVCKVHTHQEHRLRKMVRDSVNGHSGNVMENMTTTQKVALASTALSMAREGIYNGSEASIKELIANLSGAPQAGSAALNIAKKPSMYRL